ncbi:MAG: 1-acylglycerol-3-phosphate O-acyltransferase, partial [Panacagrimonas sp.]
LDGEPLWNQGKARAVRQFAKDHKTDLKQSYAYANGDEDIAFLSSVGRPMALNAGTQLAEVAETHQWPQTRFSVRRKMPLSAKLRTVASYSAMAGSFLGGLAANKLGVPQKQALNFITAVAPEMGLAAAGIELNIIGEENLWAERPAVFVFNHQSPLDLVIAINLMRKNATGVVKQEAADMLGWGQFLKFMDAAFVDRADPEKARAALAPAVEKLKKGMSLGICPEGTRSYSPRMGPFKKGAFHMAMQAQVPIVPVVLRNAGEVMHRNAGWMRSGVVDICVLPPISVEKWKRENLDQHIADVRQLFIDTLDQWPKHGTVKAVRRKLAA